MTKSLRKICGRTENRTGDLLNTSRTALSDRLNSPLITSYLDKSSTFSLKPVTAVVPQGAVLGPLLFLLYVNDIADLLLSLARLFAVTPSYLTKITDINCRIFDVVQTFIKTSRPGINHLSKSPLFQWLDYSQIVELLLQ